MQPTTSAHGFGTDPAFTPETALTAATTALTATTTVPRATTTAIAAAARSTKHPQLHL